MSLELEILLYIEVGVKYKNALAVRMKSIFFFLFFFAGFFYMTKFVNKKKLLRYFHKSEKHLERVINFRLICFNDCITV